MLANDDEIRRRRIDAEKIKVVIVEEKLKCVGSGIVRIVVARCRHGNIK